MASGERLSKQEWTERTAAKVALAQETLVAEVTALQSGEDWQRYLAFQARLHTYSGFGCFKCCGQIERRRLAILWPCLVSQVLYSVLIHV